MFRRQPRKEDDAISEALLDAIPEVDSGKAPKAGGKHAKERARFVTVASAPEAPNPASLSHIRAELEAAFAREMDHVENAVAVALREVETRLAKAQDEIAILRMENAELERARDASAKRLEALRSLALRDGDS